MPWTTDDIADLAGTIALVTGPTSGLGLDMARVLAGAGAHVVLAARNPDRTEAAMVGIRAAHPEASLEALRCDLADLASVRDAATRFAGAHDHLDLLFANAGVMATPLRRTADGFELQIGTNHLGHFALTGLLLPQLLAAGSARVVSTSSVAARMGRIDLDDLNWERRRYERWQAYGQSKLANLLFTHELQRRLADVGAACAAVAAHPGYAATHLQQAGPELEGGTWARLKGFGFGVANRVVAQRSDAGAIPLLYAGTSADVVGGGFYGPDGPFEVRGRHPGPAQVPRAARDEATAAALWDLSEELTGVRYDLAS